MKFSKAHITILGIGGVGSWAAEGLIRSGVQTMTLIDLDEICQTNINRQLHALPSTVGKSKVRLMAERLKEINPEAQIHFIEDFFSKENKSNIIPANTDVIIDAIDGLVEKCELASIAIEKDIDLVVCGGAAGKSDPTKFIQTI